MVRKSLLVISLGVFSNLLYAQKFKVEAISPDLRGSVYSPAYYENHLIVCCDQKDRIAKTVVDQDGKEPVDLYVVDPNNPSDVNRFENQFRTIYNDGPITFNKAGDICVVSRNLKTEQKLKNLQKDENPLGIYISKKYGGVWSMPTTLNCNSPQYHCTHPALTDDGNTIVFASDMPGGQGGFDLWMIKLKVGIWSKPVNLGPRINSEENEFFPSIDGDQIYFSSDRGKFGGLDIYYTDLNSMREVKVLSEPINSKSDDFGLITRNGMESGYFSTNRNGKDEVWKFEFDWPEFENCDTLIVEDFCYTLFEENAKDLDDIGSLVYEWDINGVKRRGVEVRYCFPGPGDYEINLDVIDTLINQTYFNQAYYFVSLEYKQQAYIECPDTVKPNQEFILSADKTNLPDMSIEQYFWDFGDGIKRIGKESSHQFQIPGVYTVQLGVTGFQSEARVTECVTKTVVCMDSSITIVDNIANLIPAELANSDLLKDIQFFNVGPHETGYVAYTIEAFRSDSAVDMNSFPFNLLKQYSSRVEHNEENDEYIYYVGEYNKFTDAHETWVELKKLGFEDAVVRSILLDESPVNISMTETFVLEHVQFDVAKWDIREDALADLNKLLDIMLRAPHLLLRISAHTDNRGTFEENMTLSKRRARSVRDWLVANGVAELRITSEGFGQTKPVDTNETDEGRQKNRRVEFKFINE